MRVEIGKSVILMPYLRGFFAQMVPSQHMTGRGRPHEKHLVFEGRITQKKSAI